MKLLPFIAIATMCLVSTAPAQDATPPARPPGVEEAKWTPITPTFGFVVTDDVRHGAVKDPATGKMRKFIASKQVTGYFVIVREGVWCRVDIAPSTAQLMPLTITK